MGAFELILAKFVLGYTLQSVTYMLAVYAMNKKKADIQVFSIASIIFALATYLIRESELVTIDFGVHTVLLLIVVVLLGVGFIKANIYLTAIAAIITSVSIIITEVITAIGVGLIFRFNTSESEAFFQSEFNKAVAIIPANLLLFAIIYMVYQKRTESKQE